MTGTVYFVDGVRGEYVVYSKDNGKHYVYRGKQKGQVHIVQVLKVRLFQMIHITGK